MTSDPTAADRLSGAGHRRLARRRHGGRPRGRLRARGARLPVARVAVPRPDVDAGPGPLADATGAGAAGARRRRWRRRRRHHVPRPPADLAPRVLRGRLHARLGPPEALDGDRGALRRALRRHARARGADAAHDVAARPVGAHRRLVRGRHPPPRAGGVRARHLSPLVEGRARRSGRLRRRRACTACTRRRARQLVDGILPAAPLDLYEAGCRDALAPARTARAPASSATRPCTRLCMRPAARAAHSPPVDHLFWDVPRRAAPPRRVTCQKL